MPMAAGMMMKWRTLRTMPKKIMHGQEGDLDVVIESQLIKYRV